jgi:hypothetical protein
LFFRGLSSEADIVSEAMINCARCGREHDSGPLVAGRAVICACGAWVALVEPDDYLDARRDVEDLARRADRITSLLLYSELRPVDIEIEIDKLRDFCRERFPDRLELFEMVYVARWRRLVEQRWARGA